MKKIILLLFITLFIIGCSKDRYLPLSKEGSNVLETVILQPKGRDFFYSTKISTGSSTHLLLGKYKDEYTARILLKFESFPDSIVVDSAQIILYSQAILGDSSAPFDVKMYKFNSSWGESDILNPADLNPHLSEELSSTSITLSDSDAIVFDLNPEIVNQWMDTTLADANNGIWIDCDGALFIKDFYSRNIAISTVMPSLRLVYTKDDQKDTTVVFPSKDTFVLEDLTTSKIDTSLLYVGKGIVFHSFVKFDLESLIYSTATINKADLQLVINQDNSIFGASGISDLRVRRVTNDILEPEQITVDSTFYGYTASSILEDTISVDVRGLVQYWTARSTTYINYGFLLQLYGEDQTLSRVALYSSNADSLHAPKLIITYTLPPSMTDY